MPTQPRSTMIPGKSSLWAARRAQWRALGLSEAELDLPKIAVVNTSSDLAICFSHLDAIAARAKEAIRRAGGVPFEIRTAAPSDFVTSAGAGGAYVLSARDLIAHDIEVQVEGAQLDGMLCLASCDKSTPGHLMAAGRLDIPTLVLPCGYQPCGVWRGERVDIEDVFERTGWLRSEAITIDELKDLADHAITGPGVCSGMGTATSIHLAAEALGMTLPGTSAVEANSPAMWDHVDASGARIVELVREDVRPRSVMTHTAFRNATAALLAVSGSVNCVKHLQAIAAESGVDVNMRTMFDELAPEVPLLSAVRPSGEVTVEAFERAGGGPALFRQLGDRFDRRAATVGSESWSQLLSRVEVTDEGVIRPLNNPVSDRPALTIVHGSLLPGGGIVRLGGEADRTAHHRGPARIYTSHDEAVQAVYAGEVQPGDVVILRGLGVIGGPAQAFTSGVVFALAGTALLDEVAVITEGQVSGLVNRGLVIAEASPEAAAGGPLAMVQNGDPILIDIAEKRVDLDLDEATLMDRRADLKPLEVSKRGGWLGLYQRNVRPVHEGATLDAPPPPSSRN